MSAPEGSTLDVHPGKFNSIIRIMTQEKNIRHKFRAIYATYQIYFELFTDEMFEICLNLIKTSRSLRSFAKRPLHNLALGQLYEWEVHQHRISHELNNLQKLVEDILDKAGIPKDCVKLLRDFCLCRRIHNTLLDEVLSDPEEPLCDTCAYRHQIRVMEGVCHNA